MVFVDRLQSL